MKTQKIILVAILALYSLYADADQQQTLQDIQAASLDLRDMGDQVNFGRYGNQDLSRLNSSLDLRNYGTPFQFDKAEYLIPKKYIGDERNKITNLLQQLQGLCPDCRNIHVLPINNYLLDRRTTPSNIDSVSQDKCSVPDWLRQKRRDLTLYSLTRRIPYPEKGCESETISALIDNVIKSEGE